MADPGWRVEVLAEGVLRVATYGSLTEEQARAYINESQDRLSRLPEPARILGDARATGRHSRGARRLLLESMVHMPPGYLAIVGSGLRVRLWVRVLAHNSLLREVRFFAREEEALAWLRSLRADPEAPEAARS